MNFKKIGIATALGFVAMALSSAVPLMVFYEPNFAALAEKFPGIVKTTPDMVPALIGGLVWIVVMAIILIKWVQRVLKMVPLPEHGLVHQNGSFLICKC